MNRSGFLTNLGKWMMIVRANRRRGWLLWLALLATLSQTGHGQEPVLTVQAWVERLDHDSYPTRQSAARMLRQWGAEEYQRRTQPAETGNPSRQVITALQQAMSHPSQEVRLASAQILREIAIDAHDAELQRLLNPNCPASTIRLDHWPAFQYWVGDDVPARQTFATISRRLGTPSAGLAPTRHDPSQQLQGWGKRLDPYRLSPEDTTAWLILLLADLQQHDAMPHLTPRIAVAMSHSPMGPVGAGSSDDEVLVRLIDRWIDRSGGLCSGREQLLIAMRYGCHDTARDLSRHVLEDLSAPPATVVTALLVRSLLSPDDLPNLATERLSDDRVARVWQMIPSRKIRIRTEVRDVALALLLHHQGIDPRTAGFGQLQADPLLRFQDHTLGFANDHARGECRRQAEQLLASLESSNVVDSGPTVVSSPTAAKSNSSESGR